MQSWLYVLNPLYILEPLKNMTLDRVCIFLTSDVFKFSSNGISLNKKYNGELAVFMLWLHGSRVSESPASHYVIQYLQRRVILSAYVIQSHTV